MTGQFHNTIYLQGPHDPTVTWVERAGPNDGFAAINTSGASLLVTTVAEADALIRAAVAAKDLLLAAQEPRVAVCVTCDTNVYRGDAGEWYHGYDADHPAKLPAKLAASLPESHGPNHIDNAGHAYGVTAGEPVPDIPVPCPCGPGRCTCGATVSAAGVVTPAGAS